ncbi:MAG: phage tail assembly chaperone [Rhodospirillaceae bacterium]|nr:phage tail assembly chaperone [Rhodospirillaceae bacterium]
MQLKALIGQDKVDLQTDMVDGKYLAVGFDPSVRHAEVGAKITVYDEEGDIAGDFYGMVKRNLQAAQLTERDAEEARWAIELLKIQMQSIREERNKRLTDSDAVLLEDHPKNGSKAAWKTYRAALRNLPATVTDAEQFITDWVAFMEGAEGATDPWPAEPS